jgi:AraC-like DNA-binding protein
MDQQERTPSLFEVRLNSPPTYWHCEPGWEWKAQPLADHLLWYVLDGCGQMRVHGRIWALEAGSCFVFRPGAQPHGTQDHERRLVVFGMHFDIVDLDRQQLGRTHALLPPLGYVVRDTAFVTALAHHCDAGWRRGDAAGQRHSALLLQALIGHVSDEARHPVPSAVDRALDEIVRLLQHDPRQRWTVDELAERAHLSRAQFVRRFQARVGLAPTRFAIQMRLERARTLIEETDMPLSAIATALGYSDLFFFCRQFKQYLGYAPGTIRRRRSHGQDDRQSPRM